MRPGSVSSSTSPPSDDSPPFLWPLEYFNTIYRAAIEADEGTLNAIASRGMINICANNETPVGRLAAEGKFEAVTRLLSHGAWLDKALFRAAKANYSDWVLKTLNDCNYEFPLFDAAIGGFILADRPILLPNGNTDMYTRFAEAFRNVQLQRNRLPLSILRIMMRGAVAGNNEDLIKDLITRSYFDYRGEDTLYELRDRRTIYTVQYHPDKVCEVCIQNKNNLINSGRVGHFLRETVHIPQHHPGKVCINDKNDLINVAIGHFFSGRLEDFLDCVGRSTRLLELAYKNINYFLTLDNSGKATHYNDNKNLKQAKQAEILFRLLEQPELKTLLHTVQQTPPSLAPQPGHAYEALQLHQVEHELLSSCSKPIIDLIGSYLVEAEPKEIARLRCQKTMETQLGYRTKFFDQWHSNKQSRITTMTALLQEAVAEDKSRKWQKTCSLFHLTEGTKNIQKLCNRFENKDDTVLADFVNQLRAIHTNPLFEANVSRCTQFIVRYYDEKITSPSKYASSEKESDDEKDNDLKKPLLAAQRSSSSL